MHDIAKYSCILFAVSIDFINFAIWYSKVPYK